MAATALGEGSVIVFALHTAATTATENTAVCSTPNSLQRRAPARVGITDGSGRPLRMTRRFIHVSAGTQVRVRIVPPTPPPDKPRPTVELGATDALRRIGTQHTVTESSTDVAVALYFARQRGRSPFPRRAELHVTVAEAGKEPFVLVVPFAVWPSWWLLLGICISVFAGSSFLLGWLTDVGKTMQSLSTGVGLPVAILLPILVVVAGVIASAMLRFAGWVSVGLGWVTADAQ